MKLPEEIISQGGFRIGSQAAFAEAIVRDCAKAYDKWKKLDHFKVGDFPQYLTDRYSMEPE